MVAQLGEHSKKHLEYKYILYFKQVYLTASEQYLIFKKISHLFFALPEQRKRPWVCLHSSLRTSLKRFEWGMIRVYKY